MAAFECPRPNHTHDHCTRQCCQEIRNPKQSRLAQQAIKEASNEGGIFLPILVFVELGWVLKGAPGWDAARVHEAQGRLLNMEGIEVEAAPLVREALELSTGEAGFADNLIALVARNRGCSKLLTFDARFAKTGRAALLKA